MLFVSVSDNYAVCEQQASTSCAPFGTCNQMVNSVSIASTHTHTERMRDPMNTNTCAHTIMFEMNETIWCDAHSFDGLFVGSFVRWFVHSFVRSSNVLHAFSCTAFCLFVCYVAYSYSPSFPFYRKSSEYLNRIYLVIWWAFMRWNNSIKFT